MKRTVRFVLATLSFASLSLAFPALAQAEEGYVTANVNLRAGPDPSYPLIDQLQAGTAVDVQGCTSGWEWCDVIAYGNRGWVAGNYVEYEYQNQPVLLPSYGAQIGIPIVTFVIGNYWDNYYRSRPFYRERDQWYRRRIVHRPPPPPVRDPYRGPIHRSAGPGHRRDVFPSRTPPGQPRGHVSQVRPDHAVQTEHRNPPRTTPAQPSRPAPTTRPTPAPQPRGQMGPARPEQAVHAVPRNQPHPAQGSRPSEPSHQPSSRQPASKAKPPVKTDEHDHKKDDKNGH
ncbi:MAG TPA: SH3 domain-containing protein [Rhodanobacter sp.]|nr:SH3 domain-containing protein [Rhodanobacter sp.]